jgi:hypothetical protein
MKIELYDAKNIDQLQWPPSSSPFFSKPFLAPLVEKGVHHYVDNIKTDLKLLKVQDLIIPLMINDQEYENSYICSPYNFYISYALESLNIVKNDKLRGTIRTMLLLLAKLLRKGDFNKVIHVGNMPFSTNLYPPLNEAVLHATIDYLIDKFPDHALVFRGLNDFSYAQECQALKKKGASLIAYRQIYLLDATNPHSMANKTFKKDLKHLQKTDYTIIEADQLKEEDIALIVKIYEDLHIGHYSKLNPKFNQNFIHLLIKNNILKFKGLKKEDRIDGIFGYFCQNHIMISPFLGYDRTRSQEISLYELLSTLLILEAQKQQCWLHMGAGASTFKKNRKAQGYLEHLAVCYSHLSLKRRIPWILLKTMIQSIGISYMKKY